MSRNAAYVTLVPKTSYLPGALVLEQSLRSVNSQYPLVVMATPKLPQDARAVLEKRGITIKEVEYLQPEEGGHGSRYTDTWTKLRGFEMYDHDRVVLLDFDMIIMRNMDELMTLDLPKDWIAAVHACVCNPRKLKHLPADWVPGNCAYTPLVHPTALIQPSDITDSSPRPYELMNPGLVVLTPSRELTKTIHNYLATSPLIPTFSVPDQDLLAAFFKGKWKPLPWCYNALKTSRIDHTPLWRDDEIRCLHYVFKDKPWKARVGEKGTGGEYEDINRWWWKMLDKLGEKMKVDDPDGWKLVLQRIAK